MLTIARRHAEDLIPGDVGQRQSSVIDHREPVDSTLVVAPGSPTANFDKESGSVVCQFHDRLANPDFIARAIREYRKEGYTVREVVLWLCAEAQQEGAVQLLALGFDRVLLNDGKNPMFKWTKKLKRKVAK
jgi:hypothetical protein